MGIEEILGQARDLWDAMTQKRVTDYKGLVRAVHAGKKVKPEQIVEILDAVRKSFDDLTADVELMKRRDAWRAMLKEEPVLSARQSEINREREAVNADMRRRIQEIEAESQAKLDRFKSEEFDIQVRLNSIRRESPKQQLIETSSLFDEVMAAHVPPPEAIPHHTSYDHNGIYAYERNRGVAKRDIARLEKEISAAEVRRKESLAIFGVSAAIDGEVARHRRELAEANEKLREAESNIARVKAAHTAQQENAAEVEALAIAE